MMPWYCLHRVAVFEVPPKWCCRRLAICRWAFRRGSLLSWKGRRQAAPLLLPAGPDPRLGGNSADGGDASRFVVAHHNRGGTSDGWRFRHVEHGKNVSRPQMSIGMRDV